MYVEILDWRPIPISLVETDLMKIKELQDCSPHPTYEKFRQYKIVNNNLLDFMQQFFNFDVRKNSYYQVIKDGLLTHIDIARTTVYNFLIDTGGSEVYTVWYENDKETETFKIKLPINLWHKLDVTTYHNVIGIQDTRIAISVFDLN